MAANDYPNTIHDASLVSINFTLGHLNAVQDIELAFVEEVSGKLIKVKYIDVYKYRFADFELQNIILAADIYAGFDEITKFLKKENVESINLDKLRSCNYELTDFMSSVGMNGFVIYKSKEIIV